MIFDSVVLVQCVLILFALLTSTLAEYEIKNRDPIKTKTWLFVYLFGIDSESTIVYAEEISKPSDPNETDLQYRQGLEACSMLQL